MLQTTNENNYFRIFNIKPKYNINKVWLKNKYYEMCKLYHPDVSNTQNKFFEIKKAYNTLQNDRLRALHLNDINKKLSKEEQKKDKSEKIDTDFLSEVLNYEEKISINKNNNKIKKEIIKKIDECKRKYNDLVYLKKWRYYERLLDMLN